jgi:coenzyme F420-reducing hydrogenase delta subunit
MVDERQRVLALFYCQNTPGSDEQERQFLEAKYRNSLRLFPIPCSGRLEPLHLLRALEDFADAAYLIACPEGACRYFEGNRRAKKRVERARAIISSIGLEEDRIGMIIRSKEEKESLARLARRAIDRIASLPPSPVQTRQIHR